MIDWLFFCGFLGFRFFFFRIKLWLVAEKLIKKKNNREINMYVADRHLLLVALWCLLSFCKESCPPFGCWEKEKKIHSGISTVFLLYWFSICHKDRWLYFWLS
jgi:hypothetical protein